MRTLVYPALLGDATLMGMLPGGLTSDRSLLATPTVRPFGVLMHEGPSRGIGRVHRWTTVLWVHDEIGDYTRIDAALRRARVVMESLPGLVSAGFSVVDVRWQETSSDLYDDARETNVKNSTFLLVGGGL